MFMIHLCLLLCCVYVVLCWFLTSLVYVRLLASDLVPIDEALWVYLSYNPILNDLHLLKGFNCGMIELLQGFSIAKGLVFGHSQKKRDKPINPKPVLIDNNADINQNIRSTKYFPLLPELSGLQWLPHWSYNLVVFSCIFVFFIFFWA